MDDSIAYLDHSTRAGALHLLQNPSKHLNAFTLLDLMTCTDAFVLYDHLVGFWGSTYFLESKALDVDSALAQQMLSLESDAITSRHGREIFAISDMGNEDYWAARDFFDDGLEEALAPVRHELNKRLPQGLYEHHDGDGAGLLNYILHSTILGTAYFSSAIRSPLVSIVRKNINRRTFSAVETILTTVSEAQAKKIEVIKTRFYGYQASLLMPPIFRLVLEGCSSQRDFLGSLSRFRDSREARSMRRWASKLQTRINTGNIGELEAVVNEINGVAARLVLPTPTIAQQTLEFIPTGLVDYKKAIQVPVEKASKLAVDYLCRPHALLLKKLAGSLQALENDLDLVQDKFDVRISQSVLDDINWLRNLGL